MVTNPQRDRIVGTGYFVVLFLISVGELGGVDGMALYASCALLALIVLLRHFSVVHGALMLVLLYTSRFYLPPVLKNIPAAPFLVPFLISIILLSVFTPLRSTLAWFRKGNIDRFTVLLLALTGILSGTALLLWARWTNNLGIGVQMIQGAASTFPFWVLLIFGIPLFALLNALAEELVYRGAIQESLSRIFGSRILIVLILQASAFAAAHVAVGFPNGPVGYGMTIIYAAMLGYLRHKTKGILTSYLAHILADLVIGYYLCAQL